MGLRHAYVAGGTNDPAKEVSKDRWNAYHEIIEDLTFPANASPAVPAADNLNLFARKVGGRMMPAFMGPSGLDATLQPSIARNRIALWLATGNGGTDTSIAMALTTVGTTTAKAVGNASFYDDMRFREFLVTTAATTAVAGYRGVNNQFKIGATAAGRGGFHSITRWAPATGVATLTTRAFVGMRSSAVAPTDAEPSTYTNICGMGWDAADTNIQFMHNNGSGTATKIDLGASFPVPTTDRQDVYEIAMFAPPGTTQSLGYEVTNLRTGARASGVVTTDLPSTTTLLNTWGQFSVGGTSSVIGMALGSIYVETDN